MDVGQLFSSLNFIAIIALVITVLVLLFELRHVFFYKKVVQDPEIPDFDGNIHTVPSNATHIDVEEIEHGGVNKTVVIVLLGMITVLIIILLGGLFLGKKPPSPAPRILPSPTVVPTEIIEIGNVTPTSPFGESKEVPFDLSGTPSTQQSTANKQVPTTASIGGSEVSTPTMPVSVISTNNPTSTSQNTRPATTTPTLPVSGNYRIFILLTVIPIILLTLAVLL